MKLLAVASSLMGGGAERQMTLLLNHLDQREINPTLALVSKHGEFLADLNTDIVAIDLGKRQRVDAVLVVRRLAATIRAERPDVIYSKVDYTNILTMAGAWLARSSAPVVLAEESVQSMELAHVSWPKVRRALLRWAYRRATVLVSPSEGAAADLRRVVGGLGAIEVIPNMVEVSRIRCLSKSKPIHPFTGHDNPLLVCVGRLSTTKGHRDLLHALTLLNEARPCNLLILGDGPERSRLEHLAGALGIASRVAFLGFVQNPFSLIAASDVVVSPSHFESFGNVLIEAMALGRPIVTTKVPHGPEAIIIDEHTGLFAAPHDPGHLATTILRVLEDHDLAARLGKAAAAAAIAFDASRITLVYEELFHRVAADG